MPLLNYKGIIKEKRIILRTLALLHNKSLKVVDCYLIACLEGDSSNRLYSYDRNFDKFNIKRLEP